MNRQEAQSAAEQILALNPNRTRTLVGYCYTHGCYAVIVHDDPDLATVLVDIDAVQAYLRNHLAVTED